jgi:hypothetical protein
MMRWEEGEVSSESIGKQHFRALTCPRDAKPAPPGAAGKTVDQNRPVTVQRQAVWCMRGA